MSASEVQSLIAKYRSAFETHDQAGFAGARNVRTANRAADRMRKIALDIAKLAEDDKKEFAALLQADSLPLRAWAAHHLLEIIGAGEFEEAALEVIERSAESESIDAPGERLWLRIWRQKSSERPT